MNALMDVFSNDLTYFEISVPISGVILDIMTGVGWALLLGNLVFQAAKSMMSGLGFEGEDPRILITRSFVFAFLLLCSRQICDIGLSLSSTVVDLLQIPDSVSLPDFSSNMFSIDASWLLVLIMGIILIFQLIKFFFEVGERYVIVGVLTILSPLAFAMGVSRNTMDIFKGWARMYGSMCLMMILNVVFVKLIISAMTSFPKGLSAIPWLILVIALARVARKIDGIIARIGLNPAITGDGLGRGFPGMMALMVGKSIASNIISSRVAASKAGKTSAPRAAAASPGFSGSKAYASPINTSAAYHNTTQSTGTPFNPPIGGATDSFRQSSANQSGNGFSFSSQSSANVTHNGSLPGTKAPQKQSKQTLQTTHGLVPGQFNSKSEGSIQPLPVNGGVVQPSAVSNSAVNANSNTVHHTGGISGKSSPNISQSASAKTKSPKPPATIGQAQKAGGQNPMPSHSAAVHNTAAPMQTWINAPSSQQSAMIQTTQNTTVSRTDTQQPSSTQAQTTPQKNQSGTKPPLAATPAQSPLPVTHQPAKPGATPLSAQQSSHTPQPKAPAAPIASNTKPNRTTAARNKSINTTQKQTAEQPKPKGITPPPQPSMKPTEKRRTSKLPKSQEPIDVNENFQKQLNPQVNTDSDESGEGESDGQ